MIKAYLKITLDVNEVERSQAADIFNFHKAEFLATVKGAVQNELLIHVNNLQAVYAFDSVENAQGYLLSNLFNMDLIEELKPFLKGSPDMKIYKVA